MLFCRESSPSISNVPLKLPNGGEGFIQIAEKGLFKSSRERPLVEETNHLQWFV